jgi:hypothetical protein
MIGTALLDLVAFVLGCVLLSLSFGWQVGCGVAALVWFHKAS